MKLWWVHCEALIAITLAWKITRDNKYAVWHSLLHDWSFNHFTDKICRGEWFGYLHRDGSLSQKAKGNFDKGPYHLAYMLWFCARELADGVFDPKSVPVGKITQHLIQSYEEPQPVPIEE